MRILLKIICRFPLLFEWFEGCSVHISQTILCSFLLEIGRFGVQYSMALYQNTAHDLLLEGMKYGQLGTSCAFESPTLANEMSLRGVQCVCRINPVWV